MIGPNVPYWCAKIWKKSNHGKYFYVVQNFFKSGAKKKKEEKKNIKKIEQFLKV